MLRKGFALIVLVILMTNLFSFMSCADVGPKSSLTITVTNLPDDQVYMDLLVEDYFEFGGLDRVDYNGELFDALFQYEADGWYPIIAGGSPSRVFGNIACDVDTNGTVVQEYIAGVPSEFKVLIVTANNGSLLTDLLRPAGFNQSVSVDFQSGAVTVSEADDQPIGQMALTIPLTLLLEGLLLIAFKFSLKKNWILFLIANLITQVLLYFFIVIGMAIGGIVFGLIFYLIAELLVIIVELLLYLFLLQGRGKGWRVLYAVTANLISMITGFALMLI